MQNIEAVAHVHTYYIHLQFKAYCLLYAGSVYMTMSVSMERYLSLKNLLSSIYNISDADSDKRSEENENENKKEHNSIMEEESRRNR